MRAPNVARDSCALGARLASRSTWPARTTSGVAGFSKMGRGGSAWLCGRPSGYSSSRCAFCAAVHFQALPAGRSPASEATRFDRRARPGSCGSNWRKSPPENNAHRRIPASSRGCSARQCRDRKRVLHRLQRRPSPSCRRVRVQNCIIQKFSYGKSRPYVHSSGISIRVQSLNLIQLSTFSRTRILKSHTLNKRNTDKDGIWNLSGLNIQNVRTAIHLFRTLVQNLHTFIHFSRTQIQNFHSSILKFHSPILKPRFRIQKSRLPVLSLRTRILNFRTRAVENGWHAAVASVQSFRHAIRRSRTAASDFRRRIGRAFRKVVDSKGNLKDEEIRSYDRSFATSHER